MNLVVGGVVEVNTADIIACQIEGLCTHRVMIKDDCAPMHEWWTFYIKHLTEEDLERLSRSKKVNVKVHSMDADFVAIVETPQSPPDLRLCAGRCHGMGFESQEWGRYPWLK
jgi:hypothetical protein